jgi:hypothetical protein
MWVLEQVVEEAERQMYDEQSIRRELLELELEFDEGKLDADERERREQELLDRLADSRLRSQDPAGVWDG